jgi:RimJ/RimL family protein N-acetyltransferase
MSRLSGACRRTRAWNAGSIGTAERAGYEREGLLRSHQEIGGRRRDMLLYATVRPARS